MGKNVLDTDLTGKVCVITGAGGAICGMFAEKLAGSLQRAERQRHIRQTYWIVRTLTRCMNRSWQSLVRATC